MPLSQIVSDSIQDGAVAPVDLSSVAQYTGFKNRLINGGFGIWQRGTSTTTLGAYLADRWIVSANTSLSAVSRSTDVPSGFQYSISVAGTNYPSTYQRIESVNCTDLVGQNVTLSFWAKQTSGTTGANSMACVLYSPTVADNYTSTNVIGSSGFTGSTSWTYYSYTFTSLPASVANGLQVVVYSNLTGASTFLVTGVQLEKGVTATSFDYRPYGTELALCQRYFWNHIQTINNENVGVGQNYNTTDAYVMVFLPVIMRSQPTVGLSAASTFTKLGGGSWSSISSGAANPQSITLYCVTTGLVTGGATLLLGSTTATAFTVSASAEL